MIIQPEIFELVEELDDTIDKRYNNKWPEKITILIKRLIINNIFPRFDGFYSYYQITPIFYLKSYTCVPIILIRDCIQLYSINQVLSIKHPSIISTLHQFFNLRGSFFYSR